MYERYNMKTDKNFENLNELLYKVELTKFIVLMRYLTSTEILIFYLSYPEKKKNKEIKVEKIQLQRIFINSLYICNEIITKKIEYLNPKRFKEYVKTENLLSPKFYVFQERDNMNIPNETETSA